MRRQHTVYTNSARGKYIVRRWSSREASLRHSSGWGNFKRFPSVSWFAHPWFRYMDIWYPGKYEVLHFLIFLLQLKKDPGKPSNRKLTRPGIKPKPSKWEATTLSPGHRGGLSIIKYPQLVLDTWQGPGMSCDEDPLLQRWPKMIRDSLYSHYATRNVISQFPLSLCKVPCRGALLRARGNWDVTLRVT